MKLLSIAIPCYNSQDYMRHAIETLLAGGEDVEILVVNDGSKDKTADIAAEYQQKYPTIVRAINKENGGHGDAVMTGLKKRDRAVLQGRRFGRLGGRRVPEARAGAVARVHGTKGRN